MVHFLQSINNSICFLFWKSWVCSKEEQILLHIGSVSFTLTFLFYCFYKLIPKGMLPISLNYT